MKFKYTFYERYFIPHVIFLKLDPVLIFQYTLRKYLKYRSLSFLLTSFHATVAFQYFTVQKSSIMFICGTALHAKEEVNFFYLLWSPAAFTCLKNINGLQQLLLHKGIKILCS